MEYSKTSNSEAMEWRRCGGEVACVAGSRFACLLSAAPWPTTTTHEAEGGTVQIQREVVLVGAVAKAVAVRLGAPRPIPPLHMHRLGIYHIRHHTAYEDDEGEFIHALGTSILSPHAPVTQTENAPIALE